MPRMIREKDSSSMCISICRRHCRLSKQNSYISKDIDTLTKLCNSLKIKEQDRITAQTTCMDQYDDIINKDYELNDMIRTIFEKCKQYDREHMFDQVLEHLFPTKTYGYLLRQNRHKQLVHLEKIVTKLKSLGESHGLYPLVDRLQKQMQSIAQSIALHKNALRMVQAAKAQEQIAKERVCTQYAVNYFNACAQMGKKRAARLFPKRISRKVAENIEDKK